MRNIEERREFWSTENDREIRGMTNHALAYVDVFKGKSLLEVGPGRGGQLPIYARECTEFAIADICKHNIDALECPSKHFIEGYGTRFDRAWDVVVAWYVIHHVMPEELLSFLTFLCDHAKVAVMFNAPASPGANNPYTKDYLGDDGMKTSLHKHSLIRGLLEHNLGMSVTSKSIPNGNGCDKDSAVFIGRFE